MIIDQGTGAHHAQVQYTGEVCWTWVSGAEVVVSPVTITGVWSRIIKCQTRNKRLEAWER